MKRSANLNENKESVQQTALTKGSLSKGQSFFQPAESIAIQRIGLSNEQVVKQQLANRLPENLQLGKAMGAGDCFFDSVAQGLNQLTGKEVYTAKSLRLLCDEYAKNPKHSWVKEAVMKDGDNYTQYLTRIVFTDEEMKENERKGLNLGTAVWGRPHIEGRMICKILQEQHQLAVTLHVIEMTQAGTIEGVTNEIVLEQLIDANHTRSIEQMPKEAYSESVQQTMSASALQPKLYQPAHSDLQFTRHEVDPNGDCGYTAFGIDRKEALSRLVKNLSTVRDLLKPVVKELLLQEAFVFYLKEKSIASSGLLSAFAGYQQATGEESQRKMTALQRFADDLTTLQGYLYYDVRDKKIDLGWAHPCVLYALAKIAGIRLTFWQLNSQNELIPYMPYPIAQGSNSLPETHLLFVNSNHFDRLEVYNAKTPQERLTQFNEQSPYLRQSNMLHIVCSRNHFVPILTEQSPKLSHEANYGDLRAPGLEPFVLTIENSSGARRTSRGMKTVVTEGAGKGAQEARPCISNQRRSQQPFTQFNEQSQNRGNTAKIKRPAGHDPNTPFEYYKKQRDKYFTTYKIVNDNIIHATKEFTPAIHSCINRLEAIPFELGKKSKELEKEGKVLGDIEYIYFALRIIEFVLENREILLEQYFVVTDFLAIGLGCISKISDPVKERNGEIVPESSWWLFDLLGKLFINKFDENLPISQQLKEYETLKHFMLEKIINEDLPDILKILQQMYDTENLIAVNLKENERKPAQFALFKKEPKVLQRIAILQRLIASGIAKDQPVDQYQEALVKLVKEHELHAKLEHIRFFCVTVNNYHSLKKLLEIITRLEKIKSFKKKISQEAFLFHLVQLGEYMTHKKLTNQFREHHPKIDWLVMQFNRDCIEHADEKKYYKIIRDIRANKYQQEGLTLQALSQEVIEFKRILEQVLEREYSDPHEKFMRDYFNHYKIINIQKSSLFTEEDKSFFMAQLMPQEPQLLQQWHDILDEKATLPMGKAELSNLTRLLPKEEDINKERRLKCEEIIKTLGTPAQTLSEEDQKYLQQNLVMNAKEAVKVNAILAKAGHETITNKDKICLRNCIPKKSSADPRKAEVVKKCQSMLTVLSELRDQGNCILLPSEKKHFETSRIYKESSEKWSRILAKQQVTTIADLEQLEQLKEPIDKIILNKVVQYSYERIKAAWYQKYPKTALENFLRILESNATIKSKWQKILNEEIVCPEQGEVDTDAQVVALFCEADSKYFIEFVKLIRPIEATLPIANKMQALFKQSPANYFDKAEIVYLAIEYMNQIELYICEHIISGDFVEESIENIWLPGVPGLDGGYYQKNPKYQIFLQARNAIMQEVDKKMLATGQAEIPLDRIQQLYKEIMGEESPSERLAKDPAFPERVEKLFEKYMQARENKVSKDLPLLLEMHDEFRDAILYNLTCGLALLKKIIKFPEASEAKFLKDNYVALKKMRNELTHGDYFKNALDYPIRITIQILIKSASFILKDLQTIQTKLTEKAWSKAWAQVSVASLLRRYCFNKQATYKSLDPLTTKISNMAYPGVQTSSEVNGQFDSDTGIAKKFFAKQNNKF